MDTADEALRTRGVVCRLRLAADCRPVLSLRIDSSQVGGHAPRTRARRVEARVRSADPRAALREDTPVNRWLRALVDPQRLDVCADLEVDRWVRTALADFLGRAGLELHYDRVTARQGELARTFQHLCVHRVRGTSAELDRLAELLQRDLGLRPVAADRRERAESLLKWGRGTGSTRSGEFGAARRAVGASVEAAVAPAGAEFLNPELSLLAFQGRVLALAEDPATPLRERLRFLSIVSTNLDEFFMIRMGGLMKAGHERTEEQTDDGFTPAARLDAIASEVASLTTRQARCFRACAHALAEHGTRILSWAELDETQRAELRTYFRESIHQGLTPIAMTLSPGHPLPHFPHLSLSLAFVLLGRDGSAPRFAELELPDSAPRFVPLTPRGATRDVVPLEDVVRASLDVLYPEAHVEHASLFRVTRGGDLSLDEHGTNDLLEAVAEATRQRPRNAVVRVEVEAGMPAPLRHALVEDLRREGVDGAPPLGEDDLQEVDGLIGLRSLDELPLPDGPGVEYPTFRGSKPLPRDAAMLDAVRERDLLVHHPFERFSATVVRFLEEAAIDPDVVAIKITLYRVGDPSPIAAALLEAARRGKSVVAFVELKARFDEERNVSWARALQQAGGRVVYGLVGFKTHTKVALVVRREAGKLRTYVHAGTGNYNARSAQHYTDLSLFSADPALAADVTELFNALTGSSSPPRQLAHGALIAPHQLLPAMLDLIDREAAHARAGRDARITIKLNGLSDADVVRALYRASADGVEVDVMARSMCTLRPGVPGLSERIRVSSTVGRFLEHTRIFRFANGGDPRYYIGSADLRPRNLRRRIELLVPVRDASCRLALDRVLELYLRDPTAWDLTPSGAYVRRPASGPGAQETLMRDAASVRQATPA